MAVLPSTSTPIPRHPPSFPKTNPGPFFTWPSVFLKGGACASAFALINSFGSMGGFVGPSLIGVVSHATGSYAAAMAALGGLLALSGAALLGFPVAGTNDVRVDVMDPDETAALNPEAVSSTAAGGVSPREEERPASLNGSGCLHSGSWNGSGCLRPGSWNGSAGPDAEAGLGQAPAALGPRTRSSGSFRRP